MATINSSIVIISLPAIFRGVKLNPLGAGNVSYLLWMLMGYLLVSAVLVVSLGRLGDIYGRVRIYNAGFLVFSLSSVFLAVDPLTGGGGALWLIAGRVIQGVGGAMLMANSSAIVTDAFPSNQRGLALGINMVAGLSGSFIGLVAGGLLSEVDWRLVFWFSVPFGLLGTVWAYRSLKEIGAKNPARIDWWGNLTFAVGLSALLSGITYGIQPYGGHNMGWTNPWVLAGLIGGVVMLCVFCFIETRVAAPMFHLELFKVRAFAAGNAVTFLSSIARGGLQFMLIIWLQGIWLPLHGYSYESTPLWAGIYLRTAHDRLPHRRPAVRLSVRQVRRAGLRQWRTLPGSTDLWWSPAAAHGLLVRLVRVADRGQRLRVRAVRGAQHGGRHEQRPGGSARRSQRHDVDLPEQRDGAVHRHLLLLDGGRSRFDPAGFDVRRAQRQRRSGYGRAPDRQPAAGR